MKPLLYAIFAYLAARACAVQLEGQPIWYIVQTQLMAVGITGVWFIADGLYDLVRANRRPAKKDDRK